MEANTGGIIQNRDERFLQPTEAVDILNMHCTNEGTWTSHNVGYTVLNSGGTAYESGKSIDGMNWFIDSSYVDHLFFACNGKLKEANVSSGAASDIDASAAYTVGAQVQFMQFGTVLYTCDGNINTPRKWDGTTAGNSGGFPISDGVNSYQKPAFVQKHNNRAAYANFNGFPAHLALSDIGKAETFTTNPATTAANGWIGQIGDAQQKIRGIRSLHVPYTNQDQLVIFKDRSIYSLTGTSGLLTDSNVFTSVLVNPLYGALNDRCIVQVGNDLLALNEFGVVSYSTAGYLGTVQPVAINSDYIRTTLQTLNLAQKAIAWGIHIPTRREVWWAFPSGSNTTCDTYIVYKYPSPADPKTTPKWSRRLDANSQFLMMNGTIFKSSSVYFGSSGGIIGKMFAGSQYGSTGISWRYEYPYFNFGNERQYKRLLSAYAFFLVRATQQINIECDWKIGGNNDVTQNSLEVTTGIGQTNWGSGVYGQFYYGSSQEIQSTYIAKGNGGRLKHIITGTNNSSGTDFLGLDPYVEFCGPISHYN